MKAHKGLPSTLLKGCGYLKKGVCLCGRAALTGETIFKSELESHHDISFIGMHDHGHYCVPIISKEKVLGVINLYVPQGHKRSDLEDDFLTAVANVLAGMIERKIAEDMYHHVVSYDSLTGLLNRAQFFDRLQHEMKASKRRGQQLAVLYINVDNFKTINDAMGHDTGDAVIKEVAARLTGSVRESDTAARMSGDEFSVIASNIETINDAEVIAQKILSASREPLETPKCSLNITLSIGISIFPADTQGAAELLKQSEIALYHSKKSGKNMYSFFNPEMDAQIAERVRLENELREAIDNNELVIHYQPQIDIKNGRLTGAEALVRWQHPSNGMIPSFKFIPIAEDTGLIIPLGEQVLRRSCMQNAAWQKLGLPPITMAVNVSLKQLSGKRSLDELVLQTIYETETHPQHLELEITESFCMQNLSSTIRLLKTLNSMGVHVSIDDFGTGYSSLSYLKNLPFKKLKIDRSFVMGIPDNQDDVTIVRTIIDLAHNLRLSVIAEGVETIEQLEALRALGCDEVQGYLFSKPVPADEFELLLMDECISHGQQMGQRGYVNAELALSL